MNDSTPALTLSLGPEKPCAAMLMLGGQMVGNSFGSLFGNVGAPLFFDIGAANQAGIVCSPSDAAIVQAAVEASTNADGSRHYLDGAVTLTTRPKMADIQGNSVSQYTYLICNSTEVREEYVLLTATDCWNCEALARAMRVSKGLGLWVWQTMASVPGFPPQLTWVPSAQTA